jgi:hypothetical protein
MRLSSSGFLQQPQEGERRSLNSELWHACAGPLVSLPAVGSRIVYFPQGHSEQVAVSTNKEVDAHIPNYPNLPPQLICQLHNVTMHADVETDEVYAQMTLQPLNLQEQREPSSLVPELGAPSKQPTNYFCKTLTASDTSTHGGFSVPRRAAEKVFPPLDFTQQPPVQELIARDLHDNEWKFRHIYRGQPKRHLLTTGWSVFVSAKRLVAGDSVLFIRNENGQLLLGIRRANRSQTVMPSLVLSSDSMHIGVLAAAAHATATNSRFTVFYNPRASPSEFVIPLAKYEKTIYHTRVSAGMRFRMLFETEDSSVRRYMGTITGIGDLDPVRWPNSQWRSVKVGWDESTAGERQPRVSLWEIEPLTTFLMYPPPYPLRLKRPWPQLQGVTSVPGIKDDDGKMTKSFMWTGGDNGEHQLQGLNFQGLGMDPWMQMQDRFDSSVPGIQPDMYKAMATAALQEIRSVDSSKQLLQCQPQQPVLSQQLHCVPQPLVHRQIFQHQQYPEHILQQQAQNLQQQQHSQQNIHQQQAQSMQQQQPHHHILQNQALNVLPQQAQQHILHHAQNVQQQQSQNHVVQQLQQQSSQHQVLQQLQQSYIEQKQITSQQVQRQQQTFKISHIADALSQTPASPSHSSISLPSNVSSQSVFTDSNANLASSVSLSTTCPLQSILHSLASDENSHYPNMQRATQSHMPQLSRNLTGPSLSQDGQAPSASWYSSKRVSNNELASCPPAGQVESPLPSGGQCIMSQTQPIGQSYIPTQSMRLPELPLRDGSPEQEVVESDSQSHLLFGVNIDIPSLAIPNTGSNSRNVGNDVFAVNNSLNGSACAPGSDFSLNSSIGLSGGLDERGLLQCTPSLSQLNPPTRTFTKVYKLGSIGRSVDVTRFSGYCELRSELACMFGLEGQLEDPYRSGWQLVFVDKENDVLLLGDDPWEEFVNSVRYIKILSPPEVLQMTQEGVELLNSISIQQQTSSSSEECVTGQDSRNFSSCITSDRSLDY